MGMRNTILLALSLSLAVGAQPTLPGTAAGKLLSGWFKAFNTADRETMKAFYEVHFPERLENLDGALEFAKGTGGFDLVSVDKSEELEIAATIHERAGEGNYAKLQLKVSPGEPARILNIGVRVMPPPSGAKPLPRLAEDAAVVGWKAEIARAAAADNFAGAWLWTGKGGKVVESGAAGLADRDQKIANTVDTRFRLGSMNKMFTAVAALQLVGKGKLSLDDTLLQVLPDYPNKELAGKVRIRHLLSHTGGTGDIFTDEYEKKRLELKTLKDYVNLYGQRGLAFEPGSKWEYSNYGFLLLGVVIERVTGKSYYDYVRESIFEPAGMKDTASEPESERVARRSVGYRKGDGGKWVPNTDTLPWRGTSAGGGYSTVGDMERFGRALLTGKLLSAQLLKEATKVQFGDANYGFGFQVETTNGAMTFGHGGGAPGMNGILKILPESGQVVVVLSNLDPPAAQRIAAWLIPKMPATAAGGAPVEANR